MSDDTEMWIESGGDLTTLISDDYWCDDGYETIQQTKKRKIQWFL